MKISNKLMGICIVTLYLIVAIMAVALSILWETQDVMIDTQGILIENQSSMVNSISTLQDAVCLLMSDNTSAFYSQISLSEETQELVDDLRWKHYRYGTLHATEDSVVRWEQPVIELVDIPINLLSQLKGWKIYINDEAYYVLLIEKED